MRFSISAFALCFAFIICASAWAAPINYARSQYQKFRLPTIKDGWLSSASREQAGNYSDPNFGFFKTNSAHYWLMDYTVSNLPPFDQIAGVQLALGPENNWRGLAGMYYNCIQSDSDWIQGTQQNFTSPPPAGEPSFLYAQSPSVPWKQGYANLSVLVNEGKAPLQGDSSNIVGSYLVLDLDLSVVKDYLEGNAHGICVWGWDAAANGWDQWYFYRQPNELWVYARLTDSEQESRPVVSGQIVTAQPNPFNPDVTITVSMRGNTSLRIYDTNGRMAADLTPDRITGQAAWRACNYHSGIYIVRAVNNGRTITKQITLLK
ncbi:MAG: hypothetical protein A2487_19070 [Candidatus Raymondbacteria bacterium RifOxyC12_full_50_8]|uniref:Secretion system C-terminal sorting domain-containing protein n=1 Tax=Candidatus Raymondbacteria bacterium RIFOXYD12_FULL_49_13 TaxID=1817890 RepID=A0A1F7FH35_UNCRA|nr:MAG: hypothetical protein A2248_07170 [Candidatus Raymondbacteria bacterium RIFOXYA2_FULL_49_16]OGJ99675.1 MAG: hypothetical protein A2350_17485 [Candidatus Raymondbacteria bacterium RifOxyB12_full_50_8]OGK04079.1 MAG: hypothetical protein A2487_19070 [Candidatus Raymondbacteria bacterium RifOxyC12_full_50_8]OGK05911.1 MAG: hypothetical protein A2519_23070 [Candidatus Raymondbacteria bacterium RIFOXYD12_FULL_49_13]OGP41916.1 MAG: hypothetical protein A2324_04130 [Candidatus Raymondbacteria b